MRAYAVTEQHESGESYFSFLVVAETAHDAIGRIRKRMAAPDGLLWARDHGLSTLALPEDGMEDRSVTLVAYEVAGPEGDPSYLGIDWKLDDLTQATGCTQTFAPSDAGAMLPPGREMDVPTAIVMLLKAMLDVMDDLAVELADGHVRSRIRSRIENLLLCLGRTG